MANPRRKRPQSRDTQIQIRISQRDKERVRRLAEERGVTVSRYILDRILPHEPHETSRTERVRTLDQLILVKLATGLTRQEAITQAKKELHIETQG